MIAVATPEGAVPPPSPIPKPMVFATECDLVMKGGITSGIVYPLAIVEIARAFRLRSIGGTSAGAIAAAAAAAAELGRQRFRNGEISSDPNGFGALKGLPEHLCATAADQRGTKLLAFFKPKPALRPIFDILTTALAVKDARARLLVGTKALLRHYKLPALLAVALGTLPLWWLQLAWSTLAAWLAVLLLTSILVLGFTAWAAVAAIVRELPRNRFGICSGMPEADDPAKDEALTIWLAQYFDRLSGQAQAFAGQDKPLTFGDLKAHGIDLQVMTTCLTLGRPFRLPFGNSPNVRENNLFLFKEQEFRELFPAEVVDWMKAHERPYKSADGSGPLGKINFDGFLNLPLPDDFPVVVAVRMSLSFPVLLSAIPLYAIDFRKPRVAGETPECCWFTDGGIGSNFPIHFFDSALPTRPTFGLDLGHTEDAGTQRVVFAKDNGDARLSYWRRFTSSNGLNSIAGFLATLVGVAKDWNHEALSHLPGFRDRIGLIQLTDEEGGLNLTMPAERIAALTGYGREAGLEFVRRFGDPRKWAPGTTASRMDWENHQAIRLRLFLASISELLAGLHKGSRQLAGTPQAYERFFQGPYGPVSYRFTGIGRLGLSPGSGLHTTQAGLARWILDQLLGVSSRIANTGSATPGAEPAKNAPKPIPELKLRPRI